MIEMKDRTFAAKLLIKGTCTRNYNRFYIQFDGEQEYVPFYM